MNPCMPHWLFQLTNVEKVVITNDPFARVGAPDGIDNIDAKTFNLFALNNDVKCQNHESCPCKCRIDKLLSITKNVIKKIKCRSGNKNRFSWGSCDGNFI